jgi:hypothetical protein
MAGERHGRGMTSVNEPLLFHKWLIPSDLEMFYGKTKTEKQTNDFLVLAIWLAKFEVNMGQKQTNFLLFHCNFYI